MYRRMLVILLCAFRFDSERSFCINVIKIWFQASAGFSDSHLYFFLCFVNSWQIYENIMMAMAVIGHSQ